MLSIWRAAVITLAFSLVFAVACTGWAPTNDRADRSGVAPSQETTSSPQTVDSQNVKAAAPLPSEDVPGRVVPDLPRYPDSVRVEYERDQHDALILTRARYLCAENLDAVRGFYRGVFRTEDWRVANAEFSDGEWNFLAVKGEREAEIEVRPHGAGVEAEVRMSEPLPLRQPEKRSSSDTPNSKTDAKSETASSRASGPPPTSAPAAAPATATATAPASPLPPARGGYGNEDDDWGEYEDD